MRPRSFVEIMRYIKTTKHFDGIVSEEEISEEKFRELAFLRRIDKKVLEAQKEIDKAADKAKRPLREREDRIFTPELWGGDAVEQAFKDLVAQRNGALIFDQHNNVRPLFPNCFFGAPASGPLSRLGFRL